MLERYEHVEIGIYHQTSIMKPFCQRIIKILPSVILNLSQNVGYVMDELFLELIKPVHQNKLFLK